MQMIAVREASWALKPVVVMTLMPKESVVPRHVLEQLLAPGYGAFRVTRSGMYVQKNKNGIGTRLKLTTCSEKTVTLSVYMKDECTIN